jgi:hypothetical protein
MVPFVNFVGKQFLHKSPAPWADTAFGCQLIDWHLEHEPMPAKQQDHLLAIATLLASCQNNKVPFIV